MAERGITGHCDICDAFIRRLDAELASAKEVLITVALLETLIPHQTETLRIMGARAREALDRLDRL